MSLTSHLERQRFKAGISGTFHSFGDKPTDYNYLALLICILNPKYSVNDSLVAVGVINSREDFEKVEKK